MHASPPVTTLIAGVNHAATRPASTSPSFGPPVTTNEKMPLRRPRSRSGTVDLQDRGAEDRAHHVGGPGDRQEHQRQREVRAHQTERGDRRAPARDRPDHGLALTVDPRRPIPTAAPGRARPRPAPRTAAPPPRALGRTAWPRAPGTAPPACRRSSRSGRSRRSTGSAGGAPRSGTPRPPLVVPPLGSGVVGLGRQGLHRQRGDQHAAVADEVHPVGPPRARWRRSARRRRPVPRSR